MANPYEADDVADPFREHADDTATTNNHSGGGSGSGVVQHTGASASSPTAHAVAPLNTTSLPVDNVTPPSFYDNDLVGKATGGTATLRGVPAGTAAGAEAAAAAAAAPTATTTVTATTASSRFWTLEYYQQYFDVTTSLVLRRLTSVFVPLRPPDFLRDRNWHLYAGATQTMEGTGGEGASGDAGGAAVVTAPGVPSEASMGDGGGASSEADLYGPFWVCTTLWMSIAVVSHSVFVAARNAYMKDYYGIGYCCYKGTRIYDGNVAFAMQYGNAMYDFAMSMTACAVVYLCCFGAGTGVWALMRWNNLPATLSQTVCLYGYSMVMLVTVVVLCALLPNLLQWLACTIGCAWAVTYVLSNFWRMWRATLNSRWFTAIVGLVVGCHVCLTLLIKLYFLHYSYTCSTPC